MPVPTFNPTTGKFDMVINKENPFVIPPAIEWYDPTEGLPEDPEVGDRYGADATANGWIYDYIYEWNGEEWVETAPEDGWMIWMLFELMFYVFFSGGWMEVGSESFVNIDGDTMTGDLTMNGGNIVMTGTETVDGIDISAFIDQDVSSGSTPTLTGTNFTGIPDSALDLDYVEVTGDTMIGTNSTTFFQIQQADTSVVLNVDTTNGRVGIDELRALSANGLKLYEDGGKGIFVQDSTGNVGIGVTVPTQKLNVSGNINLNTNGTAILMSSYKGANSIGNNLFIGGGGQSSIGEAGATHKGSYNTAQGVNALQYNTTGYSNSAQGVQALYSNTTGNYNSAQGMQALRSNTTGNYNSAQGVQALYSNTTGNNNSAQGVQALYSNTTGNYNSAQGYAALRSNTTGNNNSAQGVQALYSNTTGNYNSAQGMQALRSNTTGYSNSAQGYAALLYNTTGYSNSAQGYAALRSNTTGNNNSAQGVQALYSNTTGNYNSAQGVQAGRSIIDGNSNTFVGYAAGYHASQLTSASNSMALGNGAYTTASNQVVIGNTAITDIYANQNGTATIRAGKFQLSDLNTAPASKTATGTKGEIRVTADAIYVCSATDTWVKCNLATW